jgi:hypothetical protein
VGRQHIEAQEAEWCQVSRSQESHVTPLLLDHTLVALLVEYAFSHLLGLQRPGE